MLGGLEISLDVADNSSDSDDMNIELEDKRENT